MTDSPQEPPEDEASEWVMGPPADYVPPPVDELRDPEWRSRTHALGADLVREVLASHGIVKVQGRWTRED